MQYIGIDVHKKLCQACIKNYSGKILGEFSFPNSSAGIDMFLERISEHDTGAKAVIESTGDLWLRLYASLEEAGVEVLLANPSKTRAIAEARIKTDKVDARILADLLRAELVAGCYIPPKEIRELRSLVRHRATLVRDRTRVKNRIHSTLDKYELKHNFADLFGKEGIEWPKGVAAVISKVDRFVIESEIQQVKLLEQLIRDAEGKISLEAKESKDVKLLMTIPGIDYYTAMLFINEIGDIHRFSSPSKLVSWIDLALGYISQGIPPIMAG